MRFQHWVSKDKEEGIMSLIGGGRCGVFKKSKKDERIPGQGEEL